VGDPAADPDPPSGAALAVALGRGDEAGLLAVLETYGPDLLAYAEFLLAGSPDGGGPRPDPAGEAGAAVLDALLVATGAVADLVEPDRMPVWLVALTRNECLRRGASAPAAAEAAELGRRGLRPGEVAALLGFAPAELSGRVAPAHLPPAWLWAELIAAAGPGGAARRAELTRRARPFEADGFPVPLDRRRLPATVLAWSAAAVVVIALVLLVGLPGRGGAGPVASPAPLAAAASATPASPATTAEDPLPTLPATPFGATVAEAAAAPAPSPSAGAGESAAPAPAAAPKAPTGADRGSRASRTMTLTWTATGVDCAGEWTAHLYVTTGGVEASTVMAVATRAGGTVQLQRDGDGWSGDLTGLPSDRTITVTVFAGEAVRPVSARLRPDC
jgi:hypothetical protein